MPDGADLTPRERYARAVDHDDIRGQVSALIQLAEHAVAASQTLAAPRLIEEALALVHQKHSPWSLWERARLTLRLSRLWAGVGRSSTGPDSSRYWFFRT